ncbi:MAG: hypothetical protein HY911_02050 [Desulfobacterales bacterium]|nr:hypothetical protein [Desulfobacterales bacterium]
MKKILGMFLWLAVTMALTGCIKEFTPKESVIQLKAGESQTFKAVSDDRTAKLVWYLDGRKVAYDKNTYTYKAEANNGQKPIVHKLIVKEEGGRYVQYYKIAGLPNDFMSSVTWTIKVLPSGCVDGETRETTCGIGACAATGIETCSSGVFGGNTCQPGTPSAEIAGDGIDNDCDGETDETTCVPTAEVCDGVDNDCDNLVDEEIPAEPTTCGIGACAREGQYACVNGGMTDNCQPGAPIAEVAGDGIDNDCDGEVDEAPPCVPTAEVCDGLDNDCDGAVDDGIAATPTTCGVGACAGTGTSSCVNGQIVDSCQAGTPVAEACDGIDNNCDGSVDNGIAATPTTCGIGACARAGQLACVGGAMINTCQAGAPSTETCDGIDNNCDGTVDNGIASQGTTCGQGACASTGELACLNGGMSDSCQPGTPSAEVVGDGVDNDCDGQVDETVCVPTAEACDGIDNDCDGLVDDGIASVPTTCGVGACASTGASSCVNGRMVDSCQVGPPGIEVCDGIDNNCDGAVDDGIAPAPTTCGLGACASTGTSSCVAGQTVDSCVAGTPVAETCDGIDNNCNGAVDDGIAPAPTSCGLGACASTGTSSCVAGQMVDSCAAGTPVAEACNGIDDNCNGSVDDGIAPSPTTCGSGACTGTGTLSCVAGEMVDSCVAGAGSAEICDGIDNNCNGTVDENIASMPTTCGVGACVRTGASSCVAGQMVDSCVAGTPVAEVCDGIDNNCNGTADDGIASTPTTCGVGACTRTGASSCVGGQLVDSCQAGTPVAESCDGIDNNCNGSVDDGIASTPTVCGVGACARNGQLACTGGAMVDSCQPGTPGAVEICDNTIDDNCDGFTDSQDTVACAAGPPAVPTNVQATDCDPVNYDPAHGNITVTWSASQGAAYYRVYRAIFAETNAYSMVADNVTDTSFEYIQTWQADVFSIIGPTPGLSPTADFDRVETGAPYPEREAFINALSDYRDMAMPSLFNFKAPAFFRVQACNAAGQCSDMSTADVGSAEYIHTEQFSDLAQQAIPSWGYAQLISLADAPPGANGLAWCGIDLCGSGGGIAMGRVAATTRVNIDVAYNEYTEALAIAPGSYFQASGRLGGRMAAADANNGKFLLSGTFTIRMPGRPDITLAMYARIGFTATDGTRFSDGVAAITYKGLTYQFTLPIQPVDGISGHAAQPPQPVVPAVTIPPTGWTASTAAAPTPLVPEDMDPECLRVWPDYVLEECPVSVGP